MQYVRICTLEIYVGIYYMLNGLEHENTTTQQNMRLDVHYICLSVTTGQSDKDFLPKICL